MVNPAFETRRCRTHPMTVVEIDAAGSRNQASVAFVKIASAHCDQEAGWLVDSRTLRFRANSATFTILRGPGASAAQSPCLKAHPADM
jgi:hypothetical protein